MKNALIVVGVIVVVVVVAFLKGSGPEPRGSTVPETRPSSGLPRLVELGAGKCQACKAMAPIIEQLRKEYAGKIEVESIDVIEDRERARQIDFNLIPSQVFFDADGKELWRHEGFMPKDQIVAKFKELGY
ncbi:MAG TPA: thioredoxin family protein [Phycisphaerae bacterium]|nr:thioredoxin family protein [Phycisphaerae bacterium]HRR86577.1 thioredoxin family protein [Phycisphaerae bacterium]